MPPILALKLLGIARCLKDAALRYPWQIALAIALLLAWHYRSGREEARQSVAAMEKASREAEQAQAVINHEPARKSGEIAERSNAQAPAYYDSVRRAADAHRVRPKANPISNANLPGTDSVVEGVHGPDPAADLVCRAKDDDDKLIYAAARAAQMHQEALDLIAVGVAVASEGE